MENDKEIGQEKGQVSRPEEASPSSSPDISDKDDDTIAIDVVTIELPNSLTETSRAQSPQAPPPVAQIQPKQNPKAEVANGPEPEKPCGSKKRKRAHVKKSVKFCTCVKAKQTELEIPKSIINITHAPIKDDCAIFADLIAIKMRMAEPQQKEKMMNDIDYYIKELKWKQGPPAPDRDTVIKCLRETATSSAGTTELYCPPSVPTPSTQYGSSGLHYNLPPQQVKSPAQFIPPAHYQIPETRLYNPPANGGNIHLDDKAYSPSYLRLPPPPRTASPAPYRPIAPKKPTTPPATQASHGVRTNAKNPGAQGQFGGQFILPRPVSCPPQQFQISSVPQQSPMAAPAPRHIGFETEAKRIREYRRYINSILPGKRNTDNSK